MQRSYFGFNKPIPFRRGEVSQMKPEMMGNSPEEMKLKMQAIRMLEAQIQDIYESMKETS